METAAVNRLGIIGLGLIGSSIGLAARRAGILQVVGLDEDASAAAASLARQAVTELVDDVDALATCDLIVLALPLRPALKLLPKLPEGPMLTDALSTKASLAEAVANQWPSTRVCLAHPMAGSQLAGPAAASTTLFDGATCYLCSGGASQSTIDAVETFWASLGCQCDSSLGPVEHDRLMARVSHGPHATAAALALMVGNDLRRGGPGVRDATRIAAGRAEPWADILTDNRNHVVEAVEQVREHLRQIAAALQAEDEDRLLRLLDEAGQHRREVDQ